MLLTFLTLIKTNYLLKKLKRYQQINVFFGFRIKGKQFTSIDYVHQLQGTLHRGIFEGSIVINTLIVVKVNASVSCD